MTSKLLSVLALLLCSSAWGAQFDIVVESVSPENEGLIKALREVGGPGHILVHEMRSAAGDPIAKGRLLARLGKAGLLVPVGETATRFVARELSDTTIFFVGAQVVEGDYLSWPNVAGILSLDPERILRAASALGLNRVGMVYSAGYEPVAARIASLALPEGMTLVKARVAASEAMVPDLEKVLDRVDAVWILGDPLLARGAGFEFLIERSLARKIPVISPSPWGVERGALFCVTIDPRELASTAASTLNRILQEDSRLPRPRVEFASGGTLLFNKSLLERWGLTPPRDLPWRTIQ